MAGSNTGIRTLESTSGASTSAEVTGTDSGTKRLFDVAIGALSGAGFSANTTESHGTGSNTGTATAANVSGSNLVNRKYLVVTPRDGDLRWGLANTITAANGHLLKQDETGSWAIGPDLNVFLISTSGTVNFDISEVA